MHLIQKIKNRLRLWKERRWCRQCPPFHSDEDAEAILEWAGPKVKWSDGFINLETNKVTHRPELGCWGFSYPMGFISLDSLRENTKENERKAKVATALFIYLWCHRVDCGIADCCAQAYVSQYK